MKLRDLDSFMRVALWGQGYMSDRGGISVANISIRQFKCWISHLVGKNCLSDLYPNKIYIYMEYINKNISTMS